MLSHLEAVSKLQQRMGGMAWYQFDWKARRQLCAMGSTALGVQDPWNLISCSVGQSSNDPFDIIPPSPADTMQTGSRLIVSRTESTLSPTVVAREEVECATCLTEPQLDAHLEKPLSSSAGVQFAAERTMASYDAQTWQLTQGVPHSKPRLEKK